jgi:hypothetical protein
MGDKSAVKPTRIRDSKNNRWYWCTLWNYKRCQLPIKESILFSKCSRWERCQGCNKWLLSFPLWSLHRKQILWRTSVKNLPANNTILSLNTSDWHPKWFLPEMSFHKSWLHSPTVQYLLSHQTLLDYPSQHHASLIGLLWSCPRILGCHPSIFCRLHHHLGLLGYFLL